jgi:hypothetical protein
MTSAELEELVGAPMQTAERSEGLPSRGHRTYRSGGGRVTAEFVEDVLFRYSVTSD